MKTKHRPTFGVQPVHDEQQHLRSLCEIFSDQTTDFERKIDNALEKSLQMLNLDLGIISKIAAKAYTVLAYYPKEAPLSKGQIFELGKTYCSLTLEANDVVAINHMGKSKHHGHPCYSTFALESYIGVPLFVDGIRYGTLNFSSLKPAKKDFSDTDKEIVRLLGRWVASLLERQDKELELSNYHRHLEDTIDDRTSELRAINKKLLEKIESKTRTERILSEQKFFLKTLIETIPNPVFYKDLFGRYLGCNRAFEEFLGKSRSEIIGKTVYDLAPEDIADLYYEKDEELYKNPGTQHYEWKVRKNTGELREVFFDKATFNGSDGFPTGLIGLITDITERKLLESQMRQTHKLEAIGTLAGGIAHDFNNILSSILGFSELALDEVEKDSTMEDNLQEIYAGGLRAKDIVNQILAFARQSEDGKKPTRVDVIIIEALKLIRPSTPSTIEIRKEIESSSLVMGNTTQIHQLILNLCTNAAHAMEDNGGIMEVTLKDVHFGEIINIPEGLEKGKYIELAISDTGSGIEPEHIDSIFDPYFTTKKAGKGTGMGLSMARGIVESYGGTILVESSPSVKTRFTIYLPITSNLDNEITFENKTLPKGDEHILFVDDEPPIARMGSRMLESLGYQVTTRTSSIEALELFKAKPDDFQLVITDMTMPHMTGDKFAIELKQIRADIPIVLCTGYSNKIDADIAQKIGINAFTYKPFSKADLASTVREVLDKA